MNHFNFFRGKKNHLWLKLFAKFDHNSQVVSVPRQNSFSVANVLFAKQILPGSTDKCAKCRLPHKNSSFVYTSGTDIAQV